MPTTTCFVKTAKSSTPYLCIYQRGNPNFLEVKYQLELFHHATNNFLFKEHCNDPASVEHPCSTSDLASEATNFCSKILNDPIFKKCHSVLDEQHYYEACRWDYCSTKSTTASCQTISIFVSECKRKGVQFDEFWREENFCGILRVLRILNSFVNFQYRFPVRRRIYLQTVCPCDGSNLPICFRCAPAGRILRRRMLLP
jgi:hypothetical protein